MMGWGGVDGAAIFAKTSPKSAKAGLAGFGF
jgi:hypothetical protein